jgi:OHCU decarboxylase
MLACGPFDTVEKVLRCSRECWSLLGEEELLEALNAHPRIGEDVPGGGWSALEQATARESPAPGQDLVAANREYERRFGFRFVVFAEGKSAALILGLMRRRLRNDRDEEMRLAARQAALITQSRLRKLAAP